jgi:hypothetical protein
MTRHANNKKLNWIIIIIREFCCTSSSALISKYSVGTAHINSGAGHSQSSRFHLLGNGRINTFPQQGILTEIS